jgi:hypothetical protein
MSDPELAATEHDLSELVEQGLVEIVGVDPDGQLRFRLTEAGTRRAEALLGIRHE